MADATLSSSTASDQVYGRGHQTLPSFASSFRSEDYDRPPAGIAQADWARLARGRNQSRDGDADGDDSSSLQRAEDDSLEYAGRARSGRGMGGTASPASTTATTTTTAPADNRRAPISLDSSTATDTEAANTFGDDDSADAGDRTETTNYHLRSGVLDLSSSAAGGASSSSRAGGGDDSSSFANVYGGGGLRTATQDSSKGGGAMTLREQEKVRLFELSF